MIDGKVTGDARSETGQELHHRLRREGVLSEEFKDDVREVASGSNAASESRDSMTSRSETSLKCIEEQVAASYKFLVESKKKVYA